MKGWHYLFLALLGLAISVLVAFFQPAPGYMDADYYYAGGIELAIGHGFTEPYLWNYLDNPTGLPHPSHAYWMPLASILAAAGAVLFDTYSWWASRIGFLIVAAAIPPLTAALAWSLTSCRRLAWIAGFLAVFSGFYLPVIQTTDTFGLYMLFGGIFFLILDRKPSIINSFVLGVLAGLMHLTRADGMLWLVFALILTIISRQSRMVYSFLVIIMGYLLIMGPWYIRNDLAFGSPLAPGSIRALWLVGYDQLFSYPAGQLTFQSWWQSGFPAILNARLWAFGVNLANTLSVQGGIILAPFMVIGLYMLRKVRRVQLAILVWIFTLLIMTVVFPFAGARGGFFHSGAALQPFWWAVAPVGLDACVKRVANWRKWQKERQARQVFAIGLVGVSALLTTVVVSWHVLGSFGGQVWGKENIEYSQISDFLVTQGYSDQETVVVANPPGFWLASGNSAIAVPDGDPETVLNVATRYGAEILILEKNSTPAALIPLYEDRNLNSGLRYLGEVNEAHIYAIQP